MRLKLIVLVIFILGFSSRIISFHTTHPNIDELFELKSLQDRRVVDIQSNKVFYGDHTSFPGEYILHWIPLKAMGLFGKPALIEIKGNSAKVDGIDKKGFWLLAIPKILMSLFGFWLLWLLCLRLKVGEFGIILCFIVYSFNSLLISHACELRPYGILPELALLNLWLATRKESWWQVGVIIFTCIYHAYGILIAFLPLILFPRPFKFWLKCLPALIIWGFYASYNSFGIHANSVQAVVDPFQFMKFNGLLGNVFLQLFGGAILLLTVLPFIIRGFMYMTSDHLVWFSWMIFVPLVLIILVDIKTQYWIHPRQFVWIVPYLALWVGMIADQRIEYDTT